ncbi:MAG: flagellar biosynthesis protein FlhF [Peptostreptococcales bacterium]
MIIKNYLVQDMYEAMVLIKQELGNDAVIVSKREVRQKGITGLFKAKMIEVTAATEGVVQGNGIVKKQLPSQESATSLEEAIYDGNSMRQEVKEIKDIIERLVNKEQEEKNKDITSIKDMLVKMDLHSIVIQDFEKFFKDSEWEEGNFPDQKTAEKEAVKRFIEEGIEKKINISNKGGRIRTFIGPTGVGKTTTIAKLISNEVLQNNKSIGLITIDTYRIGAVEQLKIYANILGVPFKTVFSPDELPDAIQSFEDKDLIFIDSTGRNHKNAFQLNEIKTYLEKMDGTTYLVLSLGLKNTDFVRTLENYGKIGFDSIILTKLDETYNGGNILNTGYFTDKPISYICKGQIVPDDIEEAHKDNLADYIWGEMKW